MGNVRKHRDIKLFTTEKRRNYLVSELNNQTAKVFTKCILDLEMKKKQKKQKTKNKTEIPMKNLFFLGLSSLELSKILMCTSFGLIM